MDDTEDDELSGKSHFDSHDLNYLQARDSDKGPGLRLVGPNGQPIPSQEDAGEGANNGLLRTRLQKEVEQQSARMITQDIHDVPMTMEQLQAAEGILRSWLIQMRQHNPSAHLDLNTRGMLVVIQQAQNVMADYLNAFYEAMSEHAASDPEPSLTKDKKKDPQKN